MAIARNKSVQQIKLDPFQWFLLWILGCSLVAVLVLGAVVDRLLTRNVLDLEARVTAEAVQVLANLDLTAKDFQAASLDQPWIFEHVVQHLTSIPEIIRVKVYDNKGAIVWSDEPRAIGRNFVGNHELSEALEGKIEVELGRLKSEHVYEAEKYDERRLLEIYVPLSAPGAGVYGVLEIYKHPVAFFRRLDRARQFLWLICFGVGAALAIALTRIFLGARRRERGLQARALEVQAQLVQAEKMGVVGEMAAAIAHEINNPLAIMMAKAREIQSAASGTSTTCQQLCGTNSDALVREIGRITEVLRGLLVFSRKADMNLVPTDVHDVLRETAQFVEPSFSRCNVNIVPELDGQLPMVRADGNQLKQVLLNLLQNARDAMPGGGNIRVRTWAEDGQVAIEVIDSGAGILPQNINRIFDPFFSTKQDGGSGLGLSVSYGIIKEHGGSIEVSSRVGHGSLFRIVLPALE